ncbi:hypothetical protein JOM56_013311 [Amanita muscaria]
MLDTQAPTDSIFLLTLVDGETLPRDRFKCAQDVCRPPNKYADGMGRKSAFWKNCLLLRAPLEPRKPTTAELTTRGA